MTNFIPKLKRTFPALTHRNYRLFFGGNCVSTIGTWMQTIGQSWLVLQLTNDNFQIGLVAAMQFTPVLLFSLFGGVLADHNDKRKILLFTQSCLAILAASLFALTISGIIEYWMVLIFAFLLGMVNALDMPARQSLFVELVGDDHIYNAVKLNSAVFNTARLVGPAIAGLTIKWFGIAPCFLLNSISFGAVIIALLRMNSHEINRAQTKKLTFRESIVDIRTGINYIVHIPALWVPLMSLFAVNVFLLNNSVILPIYVRDILEMDITGYTMLTAAMGIGSLIAALTLTIFARTAPKKIFIFGCAMFATVAYLVLGFIKTYLPACVVLFLMGLSCIAMVISVNSTMQMKSQREMRGRVMGVYAFILGGTTPIGSLLCGWLSAKFGVSVSIITCAILCLFVILFFATVKTNRKAEYS